MKSYKHSGATGDLVYSLAVAQYLGRGDFYLHLDQIDWIGRHYYGSEPNPFHKGRLTHKDYEYMQDFMLAQPYINTFEPYTGQEVAHNLDRFRPAFVGHPGNYIDIYSQAMGIYDPAVQTEIRTQPWLTVPGPTMIEGRSIVINRTQRWLPPSPSPQWLKWQDEGVADEAVFVGLPEEYEAFQKQIGMAIPYHETRTMLELAQVIAGAEAFIGNQSQALAIAIGLGKNYACEARADLPLERNECYFADNPRGNYF
jgi:ADP-heptose:LPS heptosyltransferase